MRWWIANNGHHCQLTCRLQCPLSCSVGKSFCFCFCENKEFVFFFFLARLAGRQIQIVGLHSQTFSQQPPSMMQLSIFISGRGVLILFFYNKTLRLSKVNRIKSHERCGNQSLLVKYASTIDTREIMLNLMFARTVGNDMGDVCASFRCAAQYRRRQFARIIVAWPVSSSAAWSYRWCRSVRNTNLHILNSLSVSFVLE